MIPDQTNLIGSNKSFGHVENELCYGRSFMWFSNFPFPYVNSLNIHQVDITNPFCRRIFHVRMIINSSVTHSRCIGSALFIIVTLKFLVWYLKKKFQTFIPLVSFVMNWTKFPLASLQFVIIEMLLVV